MGHEKKDSFERLLDERGLTQRERQVVRLSVLGATAKESGAALGIAASTVSSYRQRAYEKLGVSNAQELRRLSRSSRHEPSPLERAFGELTQLSRKPFGRISSALLLIGSLLLVATLSSACFGLPRSLTSDQRLALEALGFIASATLLIVGELVYLHGYRTMQKALRALLGANDNFEQLARLHLSELGCSDLHSKALILIAQGASSSDICRRLDIARGTLNTIRHKGYAKLEVHSALQLARALLLGAESQWVKGEEGETPPSSDMPDSGTGWPAYDKETRRIIEAAQDMGFAYAGVGLAVLAIIALSILATQLGVTR